MEYDRKNKKCPGRRVKSRNRKSAVQFCFLHWLRLQISVTYREYVPSFAALAADTLLPLRGIFPVRGITCAISGSLFLTSRAEKRRDRQKLKGGSGVRGRKEKERILKGPTEWRKQKQLKKLRIVMTAVGLMLLFSVAAGAFLAWYQIQSALDQNRQQAAQPPASSFSTEEETDDVSVNLVLAGPGRPLPAGYRVQVETYQGVSVDRRILPALKKMMEDAAAAGCPLTLAEGYVDAERQDALFQAEVKRLLKTQKLSQVVAENRAQSTVGRGGQTDAQTGLSVAFAAADKNFGATPQYRWLTRNSVDYGFVQRYPAEKSAKTGMEGNAARFRYVGAENAVQMRELSMCLEEYVSYLGKRDG